jgi:glutathione S-transferase
MVLPLSWNELDRLAAEPAHTAGEPSGLPCSPQARERLFGHASRAVRVTLYRDHHAWCPYCQKVWLWLEEKRIPYRVRKVAMVCYGEKEAWFRRIVPSGMLPALELDGRLITESDRILIELEKAFGPLGVSLQEPEQIRLRGLERDLFRAWCGWLCQPSRDGAEERARLAGFEQQALGFEAALSSPAGPFLQGEISGADLVAAPFLERMNASLAYYKGYLLRDAHPAIHRWFCALEQRSTYRGTQSDFHTHAHDLPPQMGGCFASGSDQQRTLADRIDQGPWPILGEGLGDPETSESEPTDAALTALRRTLRHRAPLLQRDGDDGGRFDAALRAALSHLVADGDCPPPAGAAAALRHLRDRISVPRDMPLHAARRLRRSLEHTARLDPADPMAMPEPIPTRHRRDQDPVPFLAASSLL